MKNKGHLLLVALLLALTACGADQGSDNYGKYNRAEVRYYAYAPPLIPHEVVNRKCVNCHEQGLTTEGFTAPVTPHPQLLNCEQCHVRADESIKLFRENRFVGLKEPTTLNLPQPAGSPLIPHRVFMRENCGVCHSDSTRTEIVQTTHPERLNCVQCHVAPRRDVDLFKANTNMADAF